jgi:hypothetical protein
MDLHGLFSSLNNFWDLFNLRNSKYIAVVPAFPLKFETDGHRPSATSTCPLLRTSCESHQIFSFRKYPLSSSQLHPTKSAFRDDRHLLCPCTLNYLAFFSYDQFRTWFDSRLETSGEISWNTSCSFPATPDDSLSRDVLPYVLVMEPNVQ